MPKRQAKVEIYIHTWQPDIEQAHAAIKQANEAFAKVLRDSKLDIHVGGSFVQWDEAKPEAETNIVRTLQPWERIIP
jgi:hypothetical protein